MSNGALGRARGLEIGKVAPVPDISPWLDPCGLLSYFAVDYSALQACDTQDWPSLGILPSLCCTL